MQKVVAINLNGRAFHVEEPGYDALVAYLNRAGAALADNPDRAEILADLEQAIAEKCERLLGPNKTVIAAAEIDRILAEMGPVDAGGAEPASAEAGGTGSGAGAEPKTSAAGKRLYQIREGSMISGVCAGIAAYLDVDVTIVRIAFVVAALLTKGAVLLLYGVLMFVIPYADTPEQRAAARGQAFTAKDLIEQAKRNYADIRTNPQWRRQWRRQQREWHRTWRHATAPHAWNAQAAYASRVWTGATAPIFGLINAAFALAMIFALFSLATTQTVFGVPLPAGVPLWAGFVVVVGLYQVIAMPFIAAHRAASYPSPGLVLWMSPVTNLVWIAAIGYAMWYGYHHVPAVHDAMERVLATFREVAAGFQER
jgi:phage shock protein PspC (stress-responsive transcriptional regulator)